jgi:hypothetical protein
VLIVLGALAGCGGVDECKGDDGCEMRGHVLIGGELMAFQRCGSPDWMALDVWGNEPGVELLWEALTASSAYVHMNGRLSSTNLRVAQFSFETKVKIVRVHDAAAVGPDWCVRSPIPSP